MERISWINHKGKRILSLIFSNLDLKGMLEVIEQAKAVVSKEPQGSVLCYTETTGMVFSSESSNAIKQFSNFNKPYIKLTAVVGVEGLQKVAFNGILVFTGRRNLVLKNTKEEALDWLAAQQ